MKKIFAIVFSVIPLLLGCVPIDSQVYFANDAIPGGSETCSQAPETASLIPTSYIEPTDPPATFEEAAQTEPATSALELELEHTAGAPAAPSLPEYRVGDYELAFLEAINQARVSNDLPALVLNETACRLAYVRAKEAAVLWSHTRPDGQAYHSVYPEYAVPWPKCVGENLANHVALDVRKIVDAWMQSDGHRRNVLYWDFTGVGIAVYHTGEKYYIANMFVG